MSKYCLYSDINIAIQSENAALIVALHKLYYYCSNSAVNTSLVLLKIFQYYLIKYSSNNYYNNTSNTVKYSVKNLKYCKYCRNAASAFKPVGIL